MTKCGRFTRYDISILYRDMEMTAFKLFVIFTISVFGAIHAFSMIASSFFASLSIWFSISMLGFSSNSIAR